MKEVLTGTHDDIVRRLRHLLLPFGSVPYVPVSGPTGSLVCQGPISHRRSSEQTTVARTRDDSGRRLKENAFREMFESNYARVVRYVDRHVSDHAAAEDIAADVFRLAWQKLDPAAPFGLPWLIRTATYRARDHQRHEFRGEAVLVAMARLGEEPARDLHELDRLALYQALRELSARDLQIVMLTYWDGLSAKEVGEVLQMREGSIWTRLHRVRVRLRDILDSELTGGRIDG